MGGTIELISIDLGDTLVGSDPPWRVTFSQALRDLGYVRTPNQIFRASARLRGNLLRPSESGNNTPKLSEVLSELGILPRKEVVDYVQRAISITRREPYLMDGAIDFLEWARSWTSRVVLVSNASRNGKGPQYLERFGLKRYFQKVVFSFEVGYVKPDPRIFREATGGDPVRGFHVGDIYEVDVMGAKRAYMEGVLFDSRNAYQSGFKSLKGIISWAEVHYV